MSKSHGFVITHKCSKCGAVEDVHGGITIPDNLKVESNDAGSTLHFNETKPEQKIKQDQLSQGLQQPLNKNLLLNTSKGNSEYPKFPTVGIK